MNDYEQGFEKGYERGKVDVLLVLRDYMNELLGKNKKQSSGIKNKEKNMEKKKCVED